MKAGLPLRTATGNHCIKLAAVTLLLASVPVCCGAKARTRVTVLPDYKPVAALSGVLRSRGSKEVGALMKYWEAGFQRIYPKVMFDDTFKGSDCAMLGLEESVADMALMGRQIVPYDTYGVWRRSHHLPIEFEIATGNYSAPEDTPAVGIFVHRENPLTKLTLKQLDGIFGAQRTGGWQGMEWHTDAGRGADENIRTWGQLGLIGDWKDKAIHPYGPPGLYPGGMSYFQIRVMSGADTWAEGLREFADPNEMMKAFDRDPLGIVYGDVANAPAGAKSLALADGNGVFIPLDKKHVLDRSYPLSRSVYLYIAPDDAAGDLKAPSPLLTEFLRYIFSRQGQQEVRRQTAFLPLPLARVEIERRKLFAIADGSVQHRRGNRAAPQP